MLKPYFYRTLFNKTDALSDSLKTQLNVTFGKSKFQHATPPKPRSKTKKKKPKTKQAKMKQYSQKAKIHNNPSSHSQSANKISSKFADEFQKIKNIQIGKKSKEDGTDGKKEIPVFDISSRKERIRLDRFKYAYCVKIGAIKPKR